MDVVVPVVAYLCLATLIVGSPRVGPRRVRRQAAVVAAGLRERYSFITAPDPQHVVRTANEPPFHYGTEQEFADAVTGDLGGLPVTSATYTCRYNGSTHLYGVVAVTLRTSGERIEVRHGPVFGSAWAIDTPPEGVARSGSPAFDAAFELYFPEQGRTTERPLGPEGIKALLSTGEPFSLRLEDHRLLLWRRDGWSSADAVTAAVQAAEAAVDSVRLVG